MFRGYDKQPTSEVIAQINFVPPDMKTYKIIQTRGNSRGEKIVRELLDRETESAKKGLGSEITRANYDFVFLRQENFGVVPEYVLRIVPKRKDKHPLRGQIWVDASTSVSAELKEYQPKAPPFGSRAFISHCNMRNWVVCGYPFPSMPLLRSASWGSTRLPASISKPPTHYPLRRIATRDNPPGLSTTWKLKSPGGLWVLR